jgi:DNA-binding CsgD family transcriptional regulator
MNAKSIDFNAFNEHYSYFQQLLRKNKMEEVAPEKLEKNHFPDVQQYEALLKMTPGIILLVDYSQHSYLYHSQNISLLDVDIDLMYQYGTTYTFCLFHKDHYEVMRSQIFPEMYKLFSEYIMKGESHNLRIAYCNKMRTPSGEYKWFMHHLSVLTSSKNEPVIGLKHMIEIDQFKKDNAIDFCAYVINPDNSQNIILKKTFNPEDASILSKREKEIFALLAQGKTSKQIANELNISLHTVNNHRKNMLQKTNTANVTELMSVASQR